MSTTTTELTLTHRPAESRGLADMGWLKSAHSFSFGQYHDRNNMHFHNLRVINDDRVAPGGGFPTHPHENFEIFSYLLEGALEHKDSLGNGSHVTKDGIQFMSAGSGVHHSEFNPSSTEANHFLQIWLIPETRDTQPRYEQMQLGEAERDGKLQLFLSHDGRDGSIRTQAKADVYSAKLNGADEIHFAVSPDRPAYLHVARGQLDVNGTTLKEGDAITAEGGGDLQFGAAHNAEIVLFSLTPLQR